LGLGAIFTQFDEEIWDFVWFIQVHPITKSRLNTIHVKGNVSLEEKCQFAIVICEYK
jgi:hypothetical protein